MYGLQTLRLYLRQNLWIIFMTSLPTNSSAIIYNIVQHVKSMREICNQQFSYSINCFENHVWLTCCVVKHFYSTSIAKLHNLYDGGGGDSGYFMAPNIISGRQGSLWCAPVPFCLRMCVIWWCGVLWTFPACVLISLPSFHFRASKTSNEKVGELFCHCPLLSTRSFKYKRHHIEETLVKLIK